MQTVFAASAQTNFTQIRIGKAAVAIRRATLTDADKIADMGIRLLPAAHVGALPATDMNRYVTHSFKAETLLTDLSAPSTHFWLAESGQTISGMLKVNPAPLPIAGWGKRPLELSRLYVEFDWIGKGIGAALMRHTLEWAARARYDVCWLMVWTGNRKALAFYRRWGFNVAGTVNYLVGQSQLPAHIMTYQSGM